MLAGAVSAGFIQEKNLALVDIIDLDTQGSTEEEAVEQWGTTVVRALENWTAPVIPLL
jgi:hypothetical protein